MERQGRRVWRDRGGEYGGTWEESMEGQGRRVWRVWRDRGEEYRECGEFSRAESMKGNNIYLCRETDAASVERYGQSRRKEAESKEREGQSR